MAEFKYIMNEFWGEDTGRDILMRCLKAADLDVVPETVKVMTPGSLDSRGDLYGEDCIWWSFQLAEGSTLDDVMYYIRAAGIRVKEAGHLTEDEARLDPEGFFEMMGKRWDEMAKKWQEEEDSFLYFDNQE